MNATVAKLLCASVEVGKRYRFERVKLPATTKRVNVKMNEDGTVGEVVEVDVPASAVLVPTEELP
jgi:hypothetical protein